MRADLANEWTNGQGLPPQAISSATNTDGTALDCRDCGPEVVSHIEVGANPGNDTTIDVKLQESNDNSTFTDITGATHTQITGDSTNQHETIVAYNRTMRYVRQRWVTTGTSPTPICGGTLQARKTSF